MVSLVNLLTYGDFEGTGWTGAVAAWATDHVLYGTKSARVDAPATAAEVCIYHTGGAPLVQGHTYYARWYVYHEGAQGSTGMYFPEAEPSFSEGHPLGPAGEWQLVSGVNVRNAWASAEAATVRLDYNNGLTAGTVWFDGAMLIDLTEAFGAGSEPDALWCDSHLPFFLGTYEYKPPYTVTIKNLISDPSVELGQWSGAPVDTTQSATGSNSLRFDVGGTIVATIPVETPIVGHIYYGRRSIKTSGSSAPADCRYEVFAGDGAGLNWVIAWNNGNHPDWEAQSARWQVASVAASSYIVRCFTVNATATTWCDAFVLVDLTACFGAGNEPSQAWCDANIPVFVGEMDIDMTPGPITGSGFAVSLQPNPADVGETLLATVSVIQTVSSLCIIPRVGWQGTGPYEVLMAVDSSVTPSTECIVYGDHTMTLQQRACEYNALLRAECESAGRVRFRALSIKPTTDLPVRIINGLFPVMLSADVPVSQWAGTGPWTATVDLGRSVQSAVVGAVSGASDAQASDLMDAGIHVSAVSGSTVTLRAMLAKPTVDLKVGVLAI